MESISNLSRHLSPKFLKGDVVVRDGTLVGEYPRSLISSGGVYGLRWPPLVPAKHFGKIVQVQVQFIVANTPFRFETPAMVTRELTPRSERMGLKFLFANKAIQDRVTAAINQHGQTPADHVRKFPRIPSYQLPKEFDSDITGQALPTVLNPNPKRFSLRIGNLSPEGLLLLSNSEEARLARPGDTFDILLRASIGAQSLPEVRAKTKISRVTHEREPKMKQEQWGLGLRFSRLEEAQKKNYFTLLEEVLKAIKAPPKV